MWMYDTDDAAGEIGRAVARHDEKVGPTEAVLVHPGEGPEVEGVEIVEDVYVLEGHVFVVGKGELE